MQKILQKVALITGAARRIGAQIAEYLHENGMNIVIHYHQSHTEAEELCATLNAKRKNSAIVVRANLEDTTVLEGIIEQAVNAWGRLDVLVNSASKFYRTRMGNITEFAWNELMGANLLAPLLLSQAAVPHLRLHKGCIINIVDVHGERPMRDYMLYCMSKAGLIMQTKVMAKELGPDIRVNAIAPGETMWPEGESTMDAAMKERVISRTSLKRCGDPLDIAKAVLFLAEQADYVTGHILAVDGGRLLSS